MRRPVSVLIKPSSGNCNMRCEYCFYYDTMSKREQLSYGFMSLDTLEAVIRRVLEAAEGSCTIAYQGGEPTLSGLSFFEKSIEFEEKYNVSHVKIYHALQTNGYHLDKAWAEFFKRHDFLIGVSLDGGPKVHDRYRKTPSGGGTFYRVMENLEMLRTSGVNFNVLSVVNGMTAPQIRKTYEFYRKNHLNYLQFIACLDPLDEEPGKRSYSLTPEVYGRFLIDLFDLWYADLQQGRQPYIRQFENYIAMLLGYGPESCDMGGTCSLQYVVEADGAVYPCDFYVIDRYRLGNFHTDSVEDIDRERERLRFVEESEQKESCCETCRYFPLCRGGCRRTRQSGQQCGGQQCGQSAGHHHQYFCRSYQMFFDACLPRMIETAQLVRSQWPTARKSGSCR